jgi:hypothetical protein
MGKLSIQNPWEFCGPLFFQVANTYNETEFRYIDGVAVRDQNDISSIERLGLCSRHRMPAQLLSATRQKGEEEERRRYMYPGLRCKTENFSFTAESEH